MTTAATIKQTYDELVSKEVDESTIYRLLKRQDWRKKMPRPEHPKANPEAQAAFKKTFTHSLNKSYKPKTQKTPDQC